MLLYSSNKSIIDMQCMALYIQFIIMKAVNDCGHQETKVEVKSLKDEHKYGKYHWLYELEKLGAPLEAFEMF